MIEDAEISLVLLEVHIVVNPTSATVRKGTTQSFLATVVNAQKDPTVIWSVSGGVDTTIDTTGVLYVGEEETAKSITVTATSVEDETKVASATVVVVKKESIINPIESTKPENPSEETKASSESKEVVGGTRPQTGDVTTSTILVAMVIVSIIGMVSIKKKRSN